MKEKHLDRFIEFYEKYLKETAPLFIRLMRNGVICEGRTLDERMSIFLSGVCGSHNLKLTDKEVQDIVKRRSITEVYDEMIEADNRALVKLNKERASMGLPPKHSSDFDDTVQKHAKTICTHMYEAFEWMDLYENWQEDKFLKAIKNNYRFNATEVESIIMEPRFETFKEAAIYLKTVMDEHTYERYVIKYAPYYITMKDTK